MSFFIVRYNNTPVYERKCTFCKSEVEDEIHFIFNCTSNNTLRRPFIESLDSLCKKFKNVCNKDKFIWLMSNECENVIEIFASYIYSCFQLRKASCLTETVIDSSFM